MARNPLEVILQRIYMCYFKYKYAIITSVDVEKRFSKCKGMLLNNRRSLGFEYLQRYIIVRCNTHSLTGKIV